MSNGKIPRPGEKATFLTLLVGRDKQKEIVRMKDKGIIIGRNTKRSSVDFDTVPYEGAKKGVSREHVLITPRADFFNVQDLETVNSTWLNRVRLKPMVASELYHGDVLHLGELRIEVLYTYEDDAQEQPASTVTFNDAPGTIAFNMDGTPQAEKSTRVFGEEKPAGDTGDKTKVFTDNSD